MPEESKKISEETKLKASHFKHFIEGHYAGMFEYQKERDEKLKNMRNQVMLAKLTLFEKARIEQDFFQQESNRLR